MSTGAVDDLAKASDVARSMVMQFGMSTNLGLESFESGRSAFMPNKFDYQYNQMSEGTSRELDLEVKSILSAALAIAEEQIQKNRPFIEAAAKLLLESETLDETQIAALWKKQGLSSTTSSLSPPSRVIGGEGEFPLNR